MKKNEFLRKRYLSIVLFLVLIGGLTLAYSRLQTTLSINGNTKIDKVGWDIHFENIAITEGSVEIKSGNKAATIDANDKTKVSYNVSLVNPGDFYEFTVDIKNAGTIDAKISNIVATELTAAQESYTNYSVVYNDTGVPAIDDKLAAGATRKLKIRIEFDENVAESDLPTEGDTFDLDYAITYVQDN